GGGIDDGGAWSEFDRGKHLGDHVGRGQTQNNGAARAGNLLRGAGAHTAFGQEVVAQDPISRRGQAGSDRRPEQAHPDDADGVHMRYFPRVRPSARIRLCKFVRSIPSARAAPDTFQLDSSSARRMWSRSADSRASWM